MANGRRVQARGATRRTRAVLAATGLLAFGAGTGGAVAGASPAVTTGTIYACYSNSTRVLSDLNYPTVKTCPSGSTMISWNATGPQGAKGAQGAQGAKGAQGFKGAQGASGPQGAKGAQGAAGPQGAAGAHGAVGPQGATGPKGSVGAQGAAGAAGARGATGAQGARGLQGSSGSPGPEGPPGAAATTSGYQAAGTTKINFSGSSVIVASIAPVHSGHLAVTATTDVSASRSSVVCYLRTVSDSGRGSVVSQTRQAHEGKGLAEVTLNAVLDATNSDIIDEVCFNRSGPGFASDAALTAVTVSLDQGSGATQGVGRRAGLHNRFARPGAGRPTHAGS